MHADNAHKNFIEPSTGDHITLMNVYNQVCQVELELFFGFGISFGLVCSCGLQQRISFSFSFLLFLDYGLFVWRQTTHISGFFSSSASPLICFWLLCTRAFSLQWADTNFSTPWCYENFVQVRSMKRARDVREQILKLLERTEVVMQSNPTDFDAIKKVLRVVVVMVVMVVMVL